MRRDVAAFLLLWSVAYVTYAQYAYNPLAMNPVLEDDIMFRRTVTRLINLKEKQNKPFAAEGAHIAREIYWAVDSGYVKVYGYTDKFFERPLNKEEWDNTRKEVEDQGFGSDLTIDPSVLDFISDQLVSTEDQGASIIPPEMVSILEIEEEIIFDKRRSRMYINILSVALLAPGANVNGFDKDIGRFKYKELANYFRKKYEESNRTRCIWYNPQNNQRHLCLTDAFELRLFSSRIVKISNPDDARISEYPELRDNIEAQLYKAREIEYELMEFEHNLWEF